MPKKKYMIDTSVIIDNPASNIYNLFQNGENEIYICTTVLKELDKHKTSPKEDVSFSARTFFRSIDRKSFKKHKRKAVNGDSVYSMTLQFEEFPGTVIKLFSIHTTDYSEKDLSNDQKILEVAQRYGMRMVTNDVAFEIAALSVGVKAESIRADFISNPDAIDFSHEYKIESFDDKESFDALKKTIYEKHKKWEQITIIEENTKDQEIAFETGRKKYYVVNGAGLIDLDTEQNKNDLIKPKNIEQKFYSQLLSSPFQILTVTGSTGSGKTLLALKEGIRRVKDKNSPINGIIYMRYTVNTTDKFAELGFRKGDEDQKLGYYSYPLYSAINFMIDAATENKEETAGTKKNELTAEFIEKYNIEVYDIAHARGVTFTDKFIIFDEVQNAPNQILKLIGTRCGENAPLVLMGDYKQVDHPFLTKNRNSLVSMLRIAEKGDQMVAAIKLKHTVRSDTARWFDDKLK